MKIWKMSGFLILRSVIFLKNVIMVLHSHEDIFFLGNACTFLGEIALSLSLLNDLVENTFVCYNNI